MAERKRGRGSRLLKAVADQFPQDVISEPDVVRSFFDTLMKETGGYVIVDFLDCGNWDGLAGYDYDPKKGHLFLYWRDYRKDDASGRRRESRMVFPGSLYGLFLHLEKIAIIRATDSAVFLLDGYSLTPKDVRRILAAGAEEFELKGDSLFATHVFRKINGQWQALQVHTAALYGAVMIPKGVGAPSVASRKLLFDANLKRVLGRLTEAYQALENTPDTHTDAIAEKGNTIRRALEQALKIEICYRDVEVKKPYSQLQLGDLLALLKDYQEEDGFKVIYSKFAQWANELSHDTGRPIKRGNAVLLAVLSIAYVEMLRLSTSLDPFPSFAARMASEVDQYGSGAEASPAPDSGIGERPKGKMIFTVELAGRGVRYRQLEDGSWRRLGKKKSLAKGDFRTDEPRLVASRSPGIDSSITLDGTDFKVNPSGRTLRDNVLDSASTCFRRDVPPVPEAAQLRQALASGDDSKMNALILNVDGVFELRQRPPFDIRRNDPTIVVRHETFIRGNDYVGAAAAGDDRLIRELYESSLEAWLKHLKTGETKEYSDTPSQKNEQELLDEVEKTRGGWKPQY